MELNPRKCELVGFAEMPASLWPLPKPVRSRGRGPGRRHGQQGSEGQGHPSTPPAEDTNVQHGAPAASGPADVEAAWRDQEPEDEADVTSSEGELESEDEGAWDTDLAELLNALQEGAALESQDDEHPQEDQPPEADPACPPAEEVLPPSLLEEVVETETAAQEPPAGQPAASSSSAHDAAPLVAQAALPPPQPPLLHIGRQPAEQRIAVDGGSITFYLLKQVFTATCRNPAHGRCVLTRTAERGTRPSQGRPLGLLAAWLFMGQDLPSKESHWDRHTWPNQATRFYHRKKLAETESGKQLLAEERPCDDGEPEEPVAFP